MCSQERIWSNRPKQLLSYPAGPEKRKNQEYLLMAVLLYHGRNILLCPATTSLPVPANLGRSGFYLYLYFLGYPYIGFCWEDQQVHCPLDEKHRTPLKEWEAVNILQRQSLSQSTFLVFPSPVFRKEEDVSKYHRFPRHESMANCHFLNLKKLQDCKYYIYYLKISKHKKILGTLSCIASLSKEAAYKFCSWIIIFVFNYFLYCINILGILIIYVYSIHYSWESLFLLKINISYLCIAGA